MADKILTDIIKLVPPNVTELLPKNDLDPALLYLLQQTQHKMNTRKSCYSSILKSIEMVLERTWEELNTGHWSDVPLAPRQLYTGAAIVKIDVLLKRYANEPGDKLGLLHIALKTADLSLMLGAPLTSGNCNMTQVARLLSEAIAIVHSESTPQKKENKISTQVQCTATIVENIHGVKGKTVPSLEKPSLEKFRAEHFVPRVPVKLTGCMTHWPALERWKDMNYLKKVAGARTVPVELGAHYVDPEWSQKLMTVAEFIEAHVLQGTTDNTTVGYLAQHPLFEQVPELLADIFEPEYCCLSENLDDDATVEDTDINAWFGPKGTLSPLHHDPKHNFLAQIIGEKRILLYSPEDSEKLYPHEGSMLNNTAQVNPEKPDYITFPKYETAKAWECHLQPGEMLYIPPKWWHHVRSLCTSFSVSFWWS